MRTLYLGAGEREAALVEDGRLTEFVRDGGVDTDALILGKVVRVVPGMDAAFVDIGQERNGFLPLKENSASFENAAPLRSGDRVLVQVKREAHAEKGAFLTRDVALCGEYALLMPLNRYIGVSNKIADEKRRKALRALGEKLTGGSCGIVLRTSGADAEEEAIRADFDALLAAWEAVRKAAPTAHAPGVLYANTACRAMLRDLTPLGLDEIVRDADEAAMAVWRAEAEKALQRRVWLKSGATLVIDECEALTVIDVNTAKFTGRRALEDTALRTNLEACPEIVRQLRLRNIGGIVIIDFIDLETDKERAAVTAALTEALKADRLKTAVHGFTTLGLMEMTRKRARKPLREMLGDQKPALVPAGSDPE